MATATDGGRIRSADPRDLDRIVALWIALTEHHAYGEPLFALRADADVEIRRLLAARLDDPEAAPKRRSSSASAMVLSWASARSGSITRPPSWSKFSAPRSRI